MEGGDYVPSYRHIEAVPGLLSLVFPAVRHGSDQRLVLLPQPGVVRLELVQRLVRQVLRECQQLELDVRYLQPVSSFESDNRKVSFPLQWNENTGPRSHL